MPKKIAEQKQPSQYTLPSKASDNPDFKGFLDLLVSLGKTVERYQKMAQAAQVAQGNGQAHQEAQEMIEKGFNELVFLGLSSLSQQIPKFVPKEVLNLAKTTEKFNPESLKAKSELVEPIQTTQLESLASGATLVETGNPFIHQNLRKIPSVQLQPMTDLEDEAFDEQEAQLTRSAMFGIDYEEEDDDDLSEDENQDNAYLGALANKSVLSTRQAISAEHCMNCGTEHEHGKAVTLGFSRLGENAKVCEHCIDSLICVTSIGVFVEDACKEEINLEKAFMNHPLYLEMVESAGHA